MKIWRNWSGYSRIEAKLKLLVVATKMDNYAYYHLLSGKDMTLKTQKEIHKFFEENNGKEFLRIGTHSKSNADNLAQYVVSKKNG